MRKEEISGLLMYVVMIITALIVGLTVISPAMSTHGPNMSHLLFIIIVVLVAYVFNAFGLELLHVLGAIMGGYQVTSVNILFLCLYHNGKTWKFGLKDFNGVCGETKITPKKEKTKPNLLNWLPIFGFATEFAACIVVDMMVKNAGTTTVGWLSPASLLFLLISSLIALYNFVPLKLDTFTDGYRIRLFTKQVNMEAYNQMLIIQNKQRLGEIIEKIPVFSEITEYTAEINMTAMHMFIENKNYNEAIRIADLLIENKKVLSVSDLNRVIAQKVYASVYILDHAEAKKLYDEICPTEVRRFIANDTTMSCVRAYIMIAGMIEESESEVAYARTKIEKAKKKATPSVALSEEKLLKKTIDFVYENHPKWKKENVA